MLLRILCLKSPNEEAFYGHRASCHQCANVVRADDVIRRALYYNYLYPAGTNRLFTLMQATVNSMQDCPTKSCIKVDDHATSLTLSFGKKEFVRLKRSFLVRDSRTSEPLLAFAHASWRHRCREQKKFSKSNSRTDKINKEFAKDFIIAQQRMKEQMNDESGSGPKFTRLQREEMQKMDIVEDMHPHDAATLIAMAQEIARVNRTAEEFLVSFLTSATSVTLN